MSMRKYITICEHLMNRDFGIDKMIGEMLTDVVKDINQIRNISADAVVDGTVESIIDIIDLIEYSVDLANDSPPMHDNRGRYYNLKIMYDKKIKAIRSRLAEVIRIGKVLGRNTPIGRIVGVIDGISVLAEDVVMDFSKYPPEIYNAYIAACGEKARAKRQALIDQSLKNAEINTEKKASNIPSEVQERINEVLSPEAKARRQTAVDEMKMLAKNKVSRNSSTPQ